MGLHLCTTCNLYQPYKRCMLCSRDIGPKKSMNYSVCVLAIFLITPVVTAISGFSYVSQYPAYWISAFIGSVICGIVLNLFIKRLIRDTHNSESKHG